MHNTILFIYFLLAYEIQVLWYYPLFFLSNLLNAAFFNFSWIEYTIKYVRREKIEETRKSSHKVIIDGRDRVSISAVNDVDSFNENEIIFLTSAGMMTITGEDLHITKLNLDEGMLIIDGTVDSIDYSDHEEERMNSKKLFKVFRWI